MTSEQLPDFPLPLSDGSSFDPVSWNGDFLVLYFYPKDDTPGCTTEGIEFSKRLDEFQKLGAQVIGISRDSIASHQAFCKKHDFRILLGSDSESAWCKHFDVLKEKEIFGKKGIGVERSTFIFDRHKNLLKAMRNVKAAGHAQTVLDFLQAQASS